jgi:hypothetical protein
VVETTPSLRFPVVHVSGYEGCPAPGSLRPVAADGVGIEILFPRLDESMLAEGSRGVVKLLETIGRGGLSVTAAVEICGEFMADDGFGFLLS